MCDGKICQCQCMFVRPAGGHAFAKLFCLAKRKQQEVAERHSALVSRLMNKVRRSKPDWRKTMTQQQKQKLKKLLAPRIQELKDKYTLALFLKVYLSDVIVITIDAMPDLVMPKIDSIGAVYYIKNRGFEAYLQSLKYSIEHNPLKGKSNPIINGQFRNCMTLQNWVEHLAENTAKDVLCSAGYLHNRNKLLVVDGDKDAVIDHVPCGYRKISTDEYVTAAYYSIARGKNCYYQSGKSTVSLDLSIRFQIGKMAEKQFKRYHDPDWQNIYKKSSFFAVRGDLNSDIWKINPGEL